MTQRMVYLAYPIDQASQVPGMYNPIKAAVRHAKQALQQIGLGWYDPGAAFGVGNLEPGREIPAINHQALARATGVLAVLPGGVPTIGVPMEVERALRGWGKPVAVLSDLEGIGWSLAGDAATMEGRMTLWSCTEAGAADAVEWLACQPSGVVAGGDAPTPLPFKTAQPENWADRNDGGRLPTRAYSDDAGLDLYCSQDYKIEPSTFVDIDCGVAVELPEHTWALLTGRSSTLRKRGLLVHQGVIDPGYRGPLYAGVWNLTNEVVNVAAGERLAQLIIMSNTTRLYNPVEVQALSEHARGGNGFGSSGA